MKHLTPMVDFVLHLHSMTTSELCAAYPNRFKMPVWKGSQDEMVKDMLAIEAIKWDMVKEYAKFLKQPLQLCMFVPCDEKGNVLEEPGLYKEWLEGEEFVFTDNDVAKNYVFYNEAKEKVLFEGFTYDKSNQDLYFDEKIFLFGSFARLGALERFKLEDYQFANLRLTHTALKQIGL